MRPRRTVGLGPVRVQASAVKRTVLLLPLALLAATGCKGSVTAEAKTEKDVAEYDRPMGAAAPTADTGFGSPMAGVGNEEALIGARHDLQLAAEAPQATCKCLAVALGSATDPAFFWQSGPPRTTPAEQLVVALTSEGIACPEAKPDSLGASYWGYKVEGENVILVVEEARFGRPVTSGAIIPRPGPSGQVYVKPLTAAVPYGRPLSEGDRYCRVDVLGMQAGAPPPG